MTWISSFEWWARTSSHLGSTIGLVYVLRILKADFALLILLPHDPSRFRRTLQRRNRRWSLSSYARATVLWRSQPTNTLVGVSGLISRYADTLLGMYTAGCVTYSSSWQQHIALAAPHSSWRGGGLGWTGLHDICSGKPGCVELVIQSAAVEECIV